MRKMGRGCRRGQHFILRIQSLEGHTWKGILEVDGIDHSFDSLLELILLMERLMEDAAFPRPMRTMRSWKEEEGSLEQQAVRLLSFMRRVRLS